MTEDQHKEIFMKLIKDCSVKEGALSGDLTEIFASMKPITKPGKCILACIGETIKIVMHNHIFDDLTDIFSSPFLFLTNFPTDKGQESGCGRIN